MTIYVSELTEGMAVPEITVRVIGKPFERTVNLKSGESSTVNSTEVGDQTGEIKLVTWADNYKDFLKLGNALKITNGYVSGFRNILQLNLTRQSTVTKV